MSIIFILHYKLSFLSFFLGPHWILLLWDICILLVVAFSVVVVPVLFVVGVWRVVVLLSVLMLLVVVVSVVSWMVLWWLDVLWLLEDDPLEVVCIICCWELLAARSIWFHGVRFWFQSMSIFWIIHAMTQIVADFGKYLLAIETLIDWLTLIELVDWEVF